MAILFFGIDLAKQVLAVHAVDGCGKPALPLDKLFATGANLPPCMIGMEAVPIRIGATR